MYADSLTFDDQSGDDIVFKKIRTDQNGSQYVDQATNLSAPHTLSFRHSVNGKGSDATDRHLVQFQKTVQNSSGTARVLTVNCTVAVPRDTVITAQMVKDELANLVDFLTDGATVSIATMANVDALLRGES